MRSLVSIEQQSPRRPCDSNKDKKYCELCDTLTSNVFTDTPILDYWVSMPPVFDGLHRFISEYVTCQPLGGQRLPRKQESIPVGCIPPVWKPYMLPLSVATTRHCFVCVGGRGVRSSNELVWTGLQSSPPDVTSRWVGPQVWCPGGTPTMWPIPWCMWCYLPPPQQTDACENITFSQLCLWVVNILPWSSQPVSRPRKCLVCMWLDFIHLKMTICPDKSSVYVVFRRSQSSPRKRQEKKLRKINTSFPGVKT